ncbi:2046_t:CDS:2 [Funneliformis mosseae]|uniref:2046_t:CDS:1 n=1 Tax=Funneliformis mosseae TaxID=27381 RepID=A0A9N9G9Q9_FUNMO|nr:2046_t:CDS:2 [Funneliformis mosseae]
MKTTQNIKLDILEFINEIDSYCKLINKNLSTSVRYYYGITQDPITHDYMIVMKHMDLPNFLELKEQINKYKGRLLIFDNLPEPKNSDDYYKRYDDISSMECSVKDLSLNAKK